MFWNHPAGVSYGIVMYTQHVARLRPGGYDVAWAGLPAFALRGFGEAG